MADGSKLVLDVADDGTMRIAGTFQGPIGHVDRMGTWATADGPGGTAILSVVGVTSDR